MQTRTGNFKFNWVQIAIALLVVVYITINVFQVGGDEFVINLNNNIANPLAVGVVILTALIWTQTKEGNQNRNLWLGLGVGWVLWTVAEFWWAIAAMIDVEVPYPSWADFFWLVGYIPMYLAFAIRIRSLPRINSSSREIAIWSVSIITMLVTFFAVFIPITNSNDPSLTLESALNILYPVVDLILLILALQMYFSYQQGIYGRAWSWLSVGFILHSLSNLIFSYATTADLYYPDQTVNFISAVVIDVPYNISYLLWLIGLFIARSIQSDDDPSLGRDVSAKLVPNTHILIFTKVDNTIMDASRNYYKIFAQQDVKNRRITELIGITQEQANKLFSEITRNKLAPERSVQIRTGTETLHAFVSGIAVNGPEGQYTGATLLLRLVSTNYTWDELLTDNQKAILDSVSHKTGSKAIEEHEIKRLLTAYHGSFIKACFDRVFVEGGKAMQDGLLEELKAIASNNGWKLELNKNSIPKTEQLPLALIKNTLPALVASAEQSLAKIIDEATAQSMHQSVQSGFDDLFMENIEFFENKN